MNRDLISINDLSAPEIELIISASLTLKKQRVAGIPYYPLAGKTLGMIFHKPSARTRISFEVGMYQLGGHCVILSEKEIGMETRESVKDLAKLFSRYLDAVMLRTFSHQLVVELAQGASIPVLNGLTDYSHPCQILSDLVSIFEKKRTLKGLKIAYIGDGNNVSHSWLFAASKLGLHLEIATPEKYQPHSDVVRIANVHQSLTGANIQLHTDPKLAANNADIIYTDVWTSMGQEIEREQRLAVFYPYQINDDLVRLAKPDALIMHCLPAHRGEEITDSVIDGPNSIVFDQAENRMHTQKAILCWLMSPKGLDF
ncbi:MAG: ornithine carbamoyltransferase [bacterium]|nr:ornithine carbamoyltransferase [bacterium]